MAQEALEQAARKKGITIKVETHGQIGIENELTAEEINRQMLSLLPQTKMSIQKDLRENEIILLFTNRRYSLRLVIFAYLLSLLLIIGSRLIWRIYVETK
ncbi:hypothetical protein EfmAA290_20000 [Enterococcus faecium]|nr:hypothetical protein EfmAA290_20000 [Enterococcus faecium]